MAVTAAGDPGRVEGTSVVDYIGLAGDTKPTVAAHAGLPVPTPGSTYWAYDSNILYKTYDGTNWGTFVTLG
jgi:hypothetical protein